MTRSIGKLRIVAPGISAGLTKMWAEYTIEDDEMKERNEPLKFKNVDFERPINEIWKDAKTAISAKEQL